MAPQRNFSAPQGGQRQRPAWAAKARFSGYHRTPGATKRARVAALARRHRESTSGQQAAMAAATSRRCTAVRSWSPAPGTFTALTQLHYVLSAICLWACNGSVLAFASANFNPKMLVGWPPYPRTPPPSLMTIAFWSQSQKVKVRNSKYVRT